MDRFLVSSLNFFIIATKQGLKGHQPITFAVWTINIAVNIEMRNIRKE